MDQDSAHMVAASKVPMLKPKNGATLPKTTVVEGVTKEVPITTAEEKAQRRLEVKAKSTLIMGISNEHQLKFNSIKDAKRLLKAVEKRFGGNATTKKTQRNLLKQHYENFTASSSEMLDQTFNRIENLVYEPEVKGMSSSSSSIQNMAFMSSSNNNTSITTGVVNTAQAVNTANEVSTASTQVNVAYFINIDKLNDIKEMDLRWKMAMLTMRAKRFLKKTRRKLTVNGNKTIGFEKFKVKCYNCHKSVHFAREYRALRNQDNKNKESSRRSVPVETSTTLVSCDGLGGYDWNLKKSELMVLGYKTGFESVEKRLEFFKTNESIYLEDIKVLKVKIQMGEIAIRELRKKLEITQKEKDGIQLTIDKFKNAFKILNKLIECQIVDNYKKGLGYENYNAVPPPYTGNFMPPTPDLSFTSLDEFVNKPVVENYKAKSCEEVPKSTAMAKTINEEAQLHDRVDGKKIIITEASIKRDLQLADEDDVNCLLNSKIFKQLALMSCGCLNLGGGCDNPGGGQEIQGGGDRIEGPGVGDSLGDDDEV
nr:hypothetical protein [Tanacetum cinerariifolium]